ncbi:MAG: VWA domain-containing protein [Planctomycetota bacterium]
MIAWTLLPDASWPLLLLLPVGLLLGYAASRRAHRRIQHELGPRADAICGGRIAYPRLRAALAVLSVASFAIALLRPVGAGGDGQAAAPDLVLCVDVSRSMAAADAVGSAPSRFGQLQQHVHELLDGALGAHVALVAFAGDVHELSPRTRDRRAISWLLDELRPGALGVGGTDLGAAIASAAELLEGAGVRAGDVLLLTDGEDFAAGDGGNGESVGNPAVAAAHTASAAGHRVHAVAYGSAAGSKIAVEAAGAAGAPSAAGGGTAGSSGGRVQEFLRDGNGVEIITRCDEAALRQVVAAGGGELLRARDVSSLLPFYRDQLVPDAVERRLAAGELAATVPQFALPLLIGVLLWMLRLCVPERRR